MPENQICLLNEGALFVRVIINDSVKGEVLYVYYAVAVTFKQRIKHPPGHAPCEDCLNMDRRRSNQWISAVFFCAVKEGSQFFRLYRKVKRGMLNVNKENHSQVRKGRDPNGSYRRGVSELLPPLVAAEEEGTEEPGGNGRKRIFGRIV